MKLVTLCESVDAFLAEVDAKIPNGGEALFARRDDGELELSSLAADAPGNGWGTQAMSIIAELAGLHEVTLVTLPAGSGRKAKALAEFYGRFGFEYLKSSSAMLYRFPNKR